MRHPLELFHLFSVLQMLNDHRMVDVELFGNFSCSFQRMSFNSGSQLLLLTSDGPPLHSSSGLKAGATHSIYALGTFGELGPRAELEDTEGTQTQALETMHNHT